MAYFIFMAVIFGVVAYGLAKFITRAERKERNEAKRLDKDNK